MSTTLPTRGHRILRLARKGGRGGRTVLTGPVVRALDDYLSGPLFITKTGRQLDQPERTVVVTSPQNTSCHCTAARCH